MATQTVINVAQANRGPATFTFNAPIPVPAGLRFATIEIILDDADKLAVGKSMVLRSRFAPTLGGVYTLGNEAPWVSYGPGGLIIPPTHGEPERVNPNPRIIIGLIDNPGNPRVGLFLQVSATLDQQFFAGVLASVTS